MDLFCSVCSEGFKCPKVLPCGHSFCLECLEKWVNHKVGLDQGDGDKNTSSKGQENNKIQITESDPDHVFKTCPECRTVIILPEGGVCGFPTNVAIARASEPEPETKGNTIKGENEEVCGNCEIRKEVVVKCLVCCDFLCAECRDLHRLIKVMKSHKLIPVQQAMQEPYKQYVKDTVTYNPCTYHGGAPLQFFCKTCSVIMCATGMIKEHKHHDRISLLEAVEPGQVKLKQALKSLEEYEEKVKQVCTELKTAEETCIKDIEVNHSKILARGKDIKTYVEKLMTELINKMSDTKTAINQHQEKATEELSCVHDKICSVQALLKESTPQDMLKKNAEFMQAVQVPQYSFNGIEWAKTEFTKGSQSIEQEITALFGAVKQQKCSLSVATLDVDNLQPVLVNSFSGKVSEDQRNCGFRDVAITATGNIIVTDFSNSNVKIFDTDGQLVTVSSPGAFHKPYRISPVPGYSDEYIVTELLSYKAFKWNSQSQQKTPFAPKYSAKNYTTKYLAVTCCNETKQLLFGSQDGKEVITCDVTGENVTNFSSSDNVHWYLSYSQDVLIINHNCLSLRAYKHKQEIWCWKPQNGGVNGVHIFPSGHVLAVCRNPDEIILLSPEGQFLRKLLTVSNGLQKPRAIAYDQEKRLLVIAEDGPNMINLFRL